MSASLAPPPPAKAQAATTQLLAIKARTGTPRKRMTSPRTDVRLGPCEGEGKRRSSRPLSREDSVGIIQLSRERRRGRVHGFFSVSRSRQSDSGLGGQRRPG